MSLGTGQMKKHPDTLKILPAKNLNKLFVSCIILQFKTGLSYYPGFVQPNSMLLQLMLHSQHSCTSKEATAVCSTHPPPGCTSHIYTQLMQEKDHTSDAPPGCQHLPKQWNRDEFPKKHKQ